MPSTAQSQPGTDIGTLQGEVTAEDRDTAVRKLRRMLPGDELRDLFENLDQHSRIVEEIIMSATDGTGRRGAAGIPTSDIPELLVDMLGSELFAVRDLRERLALRCSDNRLRSLYGNGAPAGGRMRRRYWAQELADRNWHPGKRFALHFTRTLGFPLVFAGDPGTKREPATEEITPAVQLDPLADFQFELQKKLGTVLSANAGTNRAIVTLPTGAGKTRTAVETLLDFKISQLGRRAVLWIAQSDELCEQAVQSFKEIWIDRGYSRSIREPLRIGRLWDGRDVPIAECGVIVASIQQLDAMWRDERRERIAAMREVVGVIIIDEAHRAISKTYTRVLAELGIKAALKSKLPLIGLTATPYRLDPEDTRRLLLRFHNKVLRPTGLGSDPLQELRSRKILARVKFELIDYEGTRHDIEKDETVRTYYEEFEEFHPKLLRELAGDPDRNGQLLERILALPDQWSVLVFACSVEHARALTVLLRRRGRSSGCVTAKTRHATRKALIEQFRHGRLSVLCNFGVLTTGFDAPRVSAVVVARPTASPILYEQMIGRGMRGPVFGGTAKCLVLDVADNIRYRDRIAVRHYPDLEAQMRRTHA